MHTEGRPCEDVGKMTPKTKKEEEINPADILILSF